MQILFDVACWIAFILGQGLFVLRRCGLAVRSTKNPLPSRGAYLALNWDIIVIRTALEQAFFWLWKIHLLGQFVALFGIAIPHYIAVPYHPMVAFIFGFFVDAGLDRVLDSPRVPDSFKERIPELNGHAKDSGGDNAQQPKKD